MRAVLRLPGLHRPEHQIDDDVFRGGETGRGQAAVALVLDRCHRRIARRAKLEDEPLGIFVIGHEHNEVHVACEPHLPPDGHGEPADQGVRPPELDQHLGYGC